MGFIWSRLIGDELFEFERDTPYGDEGGRYYTDWEIAVSNRKHLEQEIKDSRAFERRLNRLKAARLGSDLEELKKAEDEFQKAYHTTDLSHPSLAGLGDPAEIENLVKKAAEEEAAAAKHLEALRAWAKRGAGTAQEVGALETFLQKQPLVVFDLETTSRSAAEAKIVSFAARKIYPGGKEESLSLLVNPETHIPRGASQVHGIFDADVANAGPFRKVASQVRDFLEGSALGGYNVKAYDIPILERELFEAGIDVNLAERPVVDAFSVFRGAGDVGKKNLGSALRYYTGESHAAAHEAKGDVEATLKVIRAQVKADPNVLHYSKTTNRRRVTPPKKFSSFVSSLQEGGRVLRRPVAVAPGGPFRRWVKQGHLKKGSVWSAFSPGGTSSSGKRLPSELQAVYVSHGGKEYAFDLATKEGKAGFYSLQAEIAKGVSDDQAYGSAVATLKALGSEPGTHAPIAGTLHVQEKQALNLAEATKPAALEDHLSASVRQVYGNERMLSLSRVAPYAVGLAAGADLLLARDKTAPFWGATAAVGSTFITRGMKTPARAAIAAGAYIATRMAVSLITGALDKSHEPTFDGLTEGGFAAGMRQAHTPFGSGFRRAFSRGVAEIGRTLFRPMAGLPDVVGTAKTIFPIGREAVQNLSGTINVFAKTMDVSATGQAAAGVITRAAGGIKTYTGGLVGERAFYQGVGAGAFASAESGERFVRWAGSGLGQGERTAQQLWGDPLIREWWSRFQEPALVRGAEQQRELARLQASGQLERHMPVIAPPPRPPLWKGPTVVEAGRTCQVFNADEVKKALVQYKLEKGGSAALEEWSKDIKQNYGGRTGPKGSVGGGIPSTIQTIIPPDPRFERHGGGKIPGYAFGRYTDVKVAPPLGGGPVQGKAVEAAQAKVQPQKLSGDWAAAHQSGDVSPSTQKSPLLTKLLSKKAVIGAGIAAAGLGALGIGWSRAKAAEHDAVYSEPGGALYRRGHPRALEGFGMGGVSDERRHRFTDFGTGWDPVRAIFRAAKGLGKAAEELMPRIGDVEEASYKAFLSSPEFQAALTGPKARRVEVIGKGGFGSVEKWVTEFEGKEFSFAKKTYLDETAASAMEGEAGFLSSLQDYVAPTMYGTSREASGQSVMFMEYIDRAKTVKDVRAERLLKPSEKMRIRGAVNEMHLRELVHGDLNSRNVMIDELGRPVIIDALVNRAERLFGPMGPQASKHWKAVVRASDRTAMDILLSDSMFSSVKAVGAGEAFHNIVQVAAMGPGSLGPETYKFGLQRGWGSGASSIMSQLPKETQEYFAGVAPRLKSTISQMELDELDATLVREKVENLKSSSAQARDASSTKRERLHAAAVKTTTTSRTTKARRGSGRMQQAVSPAVDGLGEFSYSNLTTFTAARR